MLTICSFVEHVTVVCSFCADECLGDWTPSLKIYPWHFGTKSLAVVPVIHPLDAWVLVFQSCNRKDQRWMYLYRGVSENWGIAKTCQNMPKPLVSPRWKMILMALMALMRRDSCWIPTPRWWDSICGWTGTRHGDARLANVTWKLEDQRDARG